VGNHYDSFAIERVTELPRHVVLIDDVVTKGRTLLAAAARVQEAFPNAEIRAFALLRTMGLVQGVEQLLDPCVGEIRWRAGDAHRTP
jgi:hypoxanthine phosphoribosyltransferase